MIDEKIYDLIQFTNGTLNTVDEIFYENTFYDNVLPKLANSKKIILFHLHIIHSIFNYKYFSVIILHKENEKKNNGKKSP